MAFSYVTKCSKKLEAEGSVSVHGAGFFCGEFSPPGGKKKRAGESNKGIFENLKKKSPYLEEKKEVRSRQI
jgi:hypothetical protein